MTIVGGAVTSFKAPASGQPDHSEAAPAGVHWWRFPLVVVQLAAVLALIAAFRIESQAFYGKLGPLILAGFIAHHLLPMAYRLKSFAVLSLGAVGLIFGLQAGAWLIGVGLMLIALCHLPIRYGARVALIVAAGLVLASMRAGWIPAPFPGSIWPILASMFMFRMIAYLYDLRHQKERTNPARTLGYFFMLPNACFPLFPVVDFNTFRRTYYDRQAIDVYEEGVRWMLRGVTQLLAYRVIYQYATISPAEVTGTADIVRYLLANFGLYLRVSGQFHLIVGILHLFGFRLPETHRFFFLASSFTDFWRRINIYWKDFMQKVVFTPALFALRKRKMGDTAALVVATLLVFVATWLLHSYQWFWLLGTWLWSATDTAFWAILAAFLVINVLREARRGRVRSLGGPVAVTAGQAWRTALATAATFATMAILWGLWTSPTFSAFFDLFEAATTRPVDFLVVAGTLGAVTLVAFAVQYLVPRFARSGTSRGLWRYPALTTAIPLILVWLAGEVPAVLPAQARQVVRDLRLAELNRGDAETLQRGYYEQIVGVNRFNGQLWEVYAGRDRPGPTLNELGVLVWHDGILHSELKPFVSVMFQGQPLRTNRWGMRDRDYQLERSPNSLRIALLGQSYVMGMGVGDGETFESLVENRLNAERGGSPFDQYEILNFAVPRYSVFQQLIILESERVLSFDPDAVLLVGHAVDFLRLVDYLHVELIRGNDLGDDFLRSRVEAAGARGDMSNTEIHRVMKPYAPEVAGWALRRIGLLARDRGVRPIFVLIPMPLDGVLMNDAPLLLQLARDAGFEVIDLSDVYEGRDEHELTVAEWDRHPNPEGHRLIAERLYDELTRLPDLIDRTRDPR
ncbi:MAG TPA: SGNH/GDSL hydrolase family protein [Gemmatimonadaceae bacterium]|nr:SGNH/GDSL hydrolase family protein [Gemmatimonadaceae bacterium]